MGAKAIFASIAGAGGFGGLITAGYFLMKANETSKTTIAPKTLLQELEGEEFKALNTNIDNSEHDKEWGELIKKHLEEAFKTFPKITTIKLVAQTDETTNPENIKALKAECQRILTKTSDFENDKETAKNWCNRLSTVIKPTSSEGIGG